MDGHRTGELPVEQIAEALEDGDVAIQPGTARAALRHRDFRIFWMGLFASNIGTWMQNVIIGAYLQKNFDDAQLVGLKEFVQLGPLVFLSMIAGAIADSVDRRRYLVAMQTLQLFGALVLATLVATDSPSAAPILACMLGIGLANAMGGPGMSAISPSLVPPEDLPGAISLFSFQMNMSRVIGPIIGQFLYASTDSNAGASAVFVINALTYSFAIYGLLAARYPRRAGATFEGGLFDRFTSGFKIAWNDPLLRRVLFILWTLSLLSLNFISFMPVHAARSFGIDPKTEPYGLLYAVFGLGAAAGAMSVGSIFAARDKASLIRPGLACFAVFLGAFALIRVAWMAYPVAGFLGYSYFLAITSLSTVMQSNISADIRGRVIALWIMGFGGAVGIAAIMWGSVAEWSVRTLIFGGAVWAAVLAVIAAPQSLRRVVERSSEASPTKELQ
jgi:MFS family permease